jgi:hypothetical protein
VGHKREIDCTTVVRRIQMWTYKCRRKMISKCAGMWIHFDDYVKVVIKLYCFVLYFVLYFVL